MIEEWKLWKHTKYALWEVSSYGRVKKNGNILSFKEGNYYIQVAGDYLHRIVAKLFIPNPENKPCIDHIDCNKHNNNVNNLRWVTYSENMNNPITRNYLVEVQLEYYSTHESPKKGLKTNKPAWNSGLTKETDERVNKGANSRIGVEPWNKGKKCPNLNWNQGQTKETNSSLKNAGEKISKLFKGRKKKVWFDEDGKKHWKFLD